MHWIEVHASIIHIVYLPTKKKQEEEIATGDYNIDDSAVVATAYDDSEKIL